MFHLLKWKPISSYSFRALTDSIQLPVYCNFCQHLSQNGLYKESLRYYSSITNTALQNSSRKKKRQRRTKKYAELLEISDKSMIETKATISNLRAKHLSLLVDNPDINLGELHKIKKLPKNVLKKNNSTTSKANNSKLSSASTKPVNDLSTSEYNSDDIKLLHEESEIHRNDVESIDPELLNEHLTGFNCKISSPLLEDSIIDRNIMEELERSEIEKIDEITESIKNVNKNTVITSEKKKNRSKKAQQVQNDATYALREKLAREDTLSRLLLAYTSLCMAQNKPQKALGAIMFYRDRAKRSETCPNVTDIRVYNCVLEGFSSKGNIGKVRDILGFLNEDKIKPNLQTYVSIFDCLGRIKKMSSVKAQLEFYQAQMQEQGYTLDDLMNNGKFINDQREVILAAIRQFKANFNPIYVAPNIQYDCSLLNSLNNAEQKHLLESIKPIDNNFRINFKENKNTAYISVPDTPLGGISLLHPNLSSFTSSKHSIENLNRSETSYTPSFTEKNLCKYNEQESKQNFFTSDFIKEKAKQQLRIESHGYISVKSIEKQTEPTDVVQHLRTKLKETQQNWQKTIIECLQRDLANLNAHSTAAGSGRGAKGAPSLSACIQALPANELAQIVLQEVQKLSEGSETYSPSTGTLYRELGFIVHSRYQVKLKSETGILDKVGNIYERYCDWYITNYNKSKNTITERQINPRQYWQTLVHADRTGPSIDVEDKVWPVSLITAVGKFLYNIILKDLKIDVNAVRVNSKQSKLLPAFYTLFRSQGHLIKEEIKAHPAVTRLFRGAQLPLITFPVNQLPMVCPPRPWVTAKQPGGYLVVHADVIRLPPQAAQQTQRLAETTMMKLYPALDSLNQLAAVPWKVNQDILDIVLDVFRSGGSARLGVAPPPSACPAALPPATGASKAERYQAFRQRMIVRRRKAEMYSLWCDALYRFSLANHYRYDTFWLPHNMDFRGRVYPVPPHLTHLGADIARSLLVFAQPQPLGPNGLRWLKLHLVNLTGTKKKNSIQERLDYANQIMPDIFDSADFPITGKMWWAKSEEPWQTLACCREIAKAVRSPDPEKYETQFPVHQDGSCNGLQHYAALGRDAAGARSVNLTPSEKPQDVYTAVANLVEETRKQDAKSGMKIAQILDGFVKRKVIKQTVMTTVYGVTRFGARLQIARQLKDIDEFPKEHVWAASSYLTGRTFDSLRSMFTSTREIQDWFTECARLVAAVCGQNLEWVTPLGLPVVQPYSRYRKVDNQGPNSKHKLQDHFCLDTYERPNIMKQKNAFPPNFIHSLDSSHMMLTSLFCERAGITFVSVHDCFWTHPSTVEIMNKICREQFVALHSEPILEDLSEFLTRKYGYDAEEVSTNNYSIDQNRKRLNRILRQLPKTGDFDLSSVLESVYFFS